MKINELLSLKVYTMLAFLSAIGLKLGHEK